MGFNSAFKGLNIQSLTVYIAVGTVNITYFSNKGSVFYSECIYVFYTFLTKYSDFSHKRN